MSNGVRTAFKLFSENAGNRSVVGVEVGVNEGVNSFNMLKHNPNLTLYGIDHYRNFSFEGDYSIIVPYEYSALHQVMAYHRLLEFEDRVRLIYKPSLEAVGMFSNNFFDFIYLDGDHRYEPVLLECEAYYPKLKIGGYFAGHDFHDTVGAGRAVLHFMTKHKFKFDFQPVNSEWDWWMVKEKEI